MDIPRGIHVIASTPRECKERAFAIIKAFGVSFEHDTLMSSAAGYPVYVATYTEHCVPGWISDLNTRLEVNYPNGVSVNIWLYWPDD